jgi:metal-sulfur cluster biosynthetic enzyme
MITIEQINKSLKTVLDPEIGINIIDLGLVYDVKIDKDNVTVVMTLTTPGCPMMAMFDSEVEKAVKKIKGVKKVKVEITFDPPWTPERMSKTARRKLRI